MYKSKPPRKAKTTKKKSMTDRLKEHSNHHSAKHMSQMKKDIKSGMSFTAAHKKAMASVGK